MILFFSILETQSSSSSSKKKSNSDKIGAMGLGATNSHDIIEHDISNLASLNQLPAAGSFESLKLSSER